MGGRGATPLIRVLLVEDDRVIARIISFYLEQESQYEVVWAKTAGEAMGYAQGEFDVVLLDILLPDVNGIDLCERLREWQDCPVIFVSALDNSDTIVDALRAGGDDFITKPFDNKVLAARIEANLRRASQTKPGHFNGTIVSGGLSLDPNRRVVTKAGVEIHLSPQESQILSLLMESPGRFFGAKEVYRRVWGKDSYGETRNVIVHIHNLRKKIESDPVCPRYIKNVWGKGYAFDPSGGPSGESAAEGADGSGCTEGGAVRR